MGTFRYPIEIAASPEGPWERLEAVVDTGAFYTWVPGSILGRSGIKPAFKRQFLLADGRTIERDVAEVVVRLDGKTRHTLCIFGDEGTEPLLGALTLEAFALAPDPINRCLVPIPRLYLLGLQEQPRLTVL